MNTEIELKINGEPFIIVDAIEGWTWVHFDSQGRVVAEGDFVETHIQAINDAMGYVRDDEAAREAERDAERHERELEDHYVSRWKEAV